MAEETHSGFTAIGPIIMNVATEPAFRINNIGASNNNVEWVQYYNKDSVKMIEMGSNATGGPEIRFGDPENTKIGFPDTDPTYFAFTNDETDFWLGNAADPSVYINYYGGGNVYIGFAGVNVCDLTVNGAIKSATATITASSDTTNVSGINTLFINITSDIVLGGLLGGVNGQVLNIVIIGNFINHVTLEHAEGIAATQDFINHTGVDELMSHGGSIYVCNGSDWYDASHAKHV